MRGGGRGGKRVNDELAGRLRLCSLPKKEERRQKGLAPAERVNVWKERETKKGERDVLSYFKTTELKRKEGSESSVFFSSPLGEKEKKKIVRGMCDQTLHLLVAAGFKTEGSGEIEHERENKPSALPACYRKVA